MEKNIDVIKNFLKSKMDKLSNDVKSLHDDANQETTIAFQLYISKAQFEKKCKIMMFYVVYERILNYVNEHSTHEAIVFIENLIERYTFNLLNCRLVQSSTDAITNITSLWESETQQKVIQDLNKLLTETVIRPF